MILECPSCHARYMVAIGLLASGGRQVRCARCRHEWRAVLPTTIDVFAPPPEAAPTQAAVAEPMRASPSFATAPQTPIAGTTANLPAVVKSPGWIRMVVRPVAIVVLLGLTVVWPIMDRNTIVKAVPELHGLYDVLGLHIHHSGDGLMFDQVKSELRYDGGTMKLFVDGVVHNTTPETQFIPDIKARAIGPDRRIIQSWWIDAPAATVIAGGDVPFHTEINAPMKRTIENVYLEFYDRDEKGNVSE